MEPPLSSPPPPPPLAAVLPKHGDLSPHQLSFLDEHFRTQEDLFFTAPLLLASLNKRCSDLDADLHNLGTNLTKRAVSWITRSFSAKTSLHNLNLTLRRTLPRGIFHFTLYLILFISHFTLFLLYNLFLEYRWDCFK